jgi:hypothetical protein
VGWNGRAAAAKKALDIPKAYQQGIPSNSVRECQDMLLRRAHAQGVQACPESMSTPKNTQEHTRKQGISKGLLWLFILLHTLCSRSLCLQ